MTPAVTILEGDCVEQMRTLKDASVQCCITSPPYFGLRAYLPAGHPLKPLEIGTEKTPDEYVAKLVAVFREVRRVLKDDGTVWLNLGDSYWGSWGNFKVPGLKPKDLIMIPARVALALQADGWYLRSDIIWHKPNPMPESVTDRPTKSHEYIFLLTKSAKYFYDAQAIQEPAVCGDPRKPYCPGQVDARGNGHDRNGGKIRESVKRGQFNGKTNAMPGRESFRAVEDWRNKRSVWTVPTSPYPEAHFATFPTALIKPCILAGTSARGCCPKCGKCWERIVNTSGWNPGCDCDGIDRRVIDSPTGEVSSDDPSLVTGRAGMNRPRGDGEGKREMTRYEQAQYAGQLRWSLYRHVMEKEAGETAFDHYIRTDFSGARPIPEHLLKAWLKNRWLVKVEIPKGEPLKPVPCTVLDPFGGSGTTAKVALELGRHAITGDLRAGYCKLIAKRTNVTPGLLMA